ncbi:Pectinesterase inhibitor domain [Macleaya cordata]|uniref:Pectinesterase inhibitor domain n=1 Tax=Macleaya cordata TaxID=56857 RepID=A0A200QT38_MACCD|nr:Pectinesterase inhibitor domain [Macleaya cordata]
MAFLRIPMVSILLLVLTLYFSHQPFMFVGADDDLILRACHNAEVPETCIQCVKADSRSDNAAIVDIATIVVDCVTSQADYLQGNISLIANHTNDPASKEVLNHCKEWFSLAKKVLYAATLGLKGGNYDSADRSVYMAVMHRLSCGGEIEQNKNITVTLDLQYGFKMYEELTEAAMRIINRLE